MQKIISIIVPVYNEEKNTSLVHAEILNIFSTLSYDYEIIYVNDGSTDRSQLVIEGLAKTDKRVKSIEFSRNFGKEAATSAGLSHSVGDAAIMIDADLQHPVLLIPKLIQRWEDGSDVVIGVRTKNNGASLVKRFGSFLYYKIINTISDTPIRSGATDFRLLDRKVVVEFNRFTENQRMTRGLIDWLGFKRDFVEFEAGERADGVASYSFLKLIKLAISSSVAHSLVPLKITGYLGLIIVSISGLSGLIILIQHYVFGDILFWNVSSNAQLVIFMIFLIGIILSCLGIIALYIGNIQSEVSNRPLYVVRSTKNLK